MVTKLTELAIVVSLITLSQRLTGYENKPFGYFLLAVAVVAALFWLYELFGEIVKKVVDRPANGQHKISTVRKLSTIAAGIILLGFVFYPWIAGQTNKATPSPAPAPAPSPTPAPVPAPTPAPSKPQKKQTKRQEKKDTPPKENLPVPSPAPKNNCPKGICGDGTIINPTVNNGPPPPLALDESQIQQLKSDLAEDKATVTIWEVLNAADSHSLSESLGSTLNAIPGWSADWGNVVASGGTKGIIVEARKDSRAAQDVVRLLRSFGIVAGVRSSEQIPDDRLIINVGAQLR